jgi:hypothetical protein
MILIVKDRSRSSAVILTNHRNSVVHLGVRNITEILMIVEIKLIASRIYDTPPKCPEKINKSTSVP